MFERVLRVKHQLMPKLGEKGVFIVANLGIDDGLSQGQRLGRRYEEKAGACWLLGVKNFLQAWATTIVYPAP